MSKIKRENLPSMCTWHTGYSAWMGRGRACWRSLLADKQFRCTCRIWQTLSAPRGSWPDHLKRTRRVGMLDVFYFLSLFKMIKSLDEHRTCAFWTALLGLCYWVFTGQSWTLDCAAFHVAFLKKKTRCKQTLFEKFCAMHLQMFGREFEQAPLCRRSVRRTWVRRAPDRDASCLLDCKSCLWKYTAPRTLHGCQQSGGWAGKRMWRRRTTTANTEEFSQKMKPHFWPTCLYRVDNHLWLM